MAGLKKRIIACLDVKDGRTVKGTRFIDLRDAGDPVELAARHAQDGADEITLLDITATQEGRTTFMDIVGRVAEVLDIPFAVGGGIASPEQAYALLNVGADKVCVNSAAVRRSGLIDELARSFGSQCITLAIDARHVEGRWMVHLDGGRTATGREALAWAQEGVRRGAGEVLLTSMDHDGMRNGFALDITRSFSDGLPVPVIASGGAGRAADFAEVFLHAQADAALAAGIFHQGLLTIPDLKAELCSYHIPVRT